MKRHLLLRSNDLNEKQLVRYRSQLRSEGVASVISDSLDQPGRVGLRQERQHLDSKVGGASSVEPEVFGLALPSRTLSGDTQFPHFVLQSSTFEPQAIGCSPLTGNPSRSGLQCIHDHIALCLFERGD